ncbi:hypothetical protein TNCV_1206261 [Trichonephila clavipes]|nr:hypothetical protein TNCV_1206261 [Trichonephila clavipes]
MSGIPFISPTHLGGQEIGDNHLEMSRKTLLAHISQRGIFLVTCYVRPQELWRELTVPENDAGDGIGCGRFPRKGS